jgi:hypothetical protein
VITTVLLTEKTLSAHDVARMASLHGDDEVRVHVVIPAHGDFGGVEEAVDDIAKTHFRDALHDEDAESSPQQLSSRAHEELAATVAALQSAGLSSVDGEVVPKHPVDAVVALAEQLGADEVVVFTEPHLVADLTRRDWATRLRHKLHLPVLHVVLGTDQVVG